MRKLGVSLCINLLGIVFYIAGYYLIQYMRSKTNDTSYGSMYIGGLLVMYVWSKINNFLRDMFI